MTTYSKMMDDALRTAYLWAGKVQVFVGDKRTHAALIRRGAEDLGSGSLGLDWALTLRAVQLADASPDERAIGRVNASLWRTGHAGGAYTSAAEQVECWRRVRAGTLLPVMVGLEGDRRADGYVGWVFVMPLSKDRDYVGPSSYERGEYYYYTSCPHCAHGKRAMWEGPCSCKDCPVDSRTLALWGKPPTKEKKAA